MFWAKKNLGSKNIFGQKDLGLKFFLSKKNQEGLTEGGGYMTPPQKIVGLKFCWVVLSCPKRFFVEKKNIGRVNPGNGGVDDPLPQKIVRLKLC